MICPRICDCGFDKATKKVINNGRVNSDVRVVKVRTTNGSYKMYTDWKEPIEVGSPLCLCDDGKVTPECPIENTQVVGRYECEDIKCSS